MFSMKNLVVCPVRVTVDHREKCMLSRALYVVLNGLNYRQKKIEILSTTESTGFISLERTKDKDFAVPLFRRA